MEVVAFSLGVVFTAIGILLCLLVAKHYKCGTRQPQPKTVQKQPQGKLLQLGV